MESAWAVFFPRWSFLTSLPNLLADKSELRFRNIWQSFSRITAYFFQRFTFCRTLAKRAPSARQASTSENDDKFSLRILTPFSSSCYSCSKRQRVTDIVCVAVLSSDALVALSNNHSGKDQRFSSRVLGPDHRSGPAPCSRRRKKSRNKLSPSGRKPARR